MVGLISLVDFYLSIVDVVSAADEKTILRGFRVESKSKKVVNGRLQ